MSPIDYKDFMDPKKWAKDKEELDRKAAAVNTEAAQAARIITAGLIQTLKEEPLEPKPVEIEVPVVEETVEPAKEDEPPAPAAPVMPVAPAAPAANKRSTKGK